MQTRCPGAAPRRTTNLLLNRHTLIDAGSGVGDLDAMQLLAIKSCLAEGMFLPAAGSAPDAVAQRPAADVLNAALVLARRPACGAIPVRSAAGL